MQEKQRRFMERMKSTDEWMKGRLRENMSEKE